MLSGSHQAFVLPNYQKSSLYDWSFIAQPMWLKDFSVLFKFCFILAKKSAPKKILQVSYTYSCVHISWNRLFWAEKQGNHQNFDPSYLTYKC